MSQSRNSFSNRWRRLRRHATDWLSTIGQWILAPIKLLFLPAKLIDLFHRSGVDTSRRTEKRTEARAKSNSRWRVLWLPFAWLFNVLMLPVRLVQTAFRRGRQRYLLYFIPLIGAVALTGFVGYQLIFRSAVIQDRYFLGAKRAVQTGRMDLATVYFRRLIDRGELTDSQSLQWAIVLLQMEDVAEYQQIVDRLASTRQPGYPPAHSFQAISLANELQQEEQKFIQGWKQNLAATPKLNSEPPAFSADPKMLDALAFHLEHADKTSKQVKNAQAIYFIYRGQVLEAIRDLTAVAEASPRLFLKIARQAKNRGADDKVKAQVKKALKEASIEFEIQLQQTPLNENVRLLLAGTYAELGDFDKADRFVNEGLRLFPTAILRRASTEIVIKRLEDEPPNNEVRSLLFAMTKLNLAIRMDPEHQLLYQKLTAMLLKFGDPKNRLPRELPAQSRDEVPVSEDLNTQELGELPLRQALEKILTSDIPNALDHCNLAYLLWIEGDQANASWHLEQAWGMDKQFSETAGRLAIQFVLQDPGNIEWGTLLARMAVEKSNESMKASLAAEKRDELANARLNLGRILFHLGETESALSEVEFALKDTRDPAKVHKMLATIHNKLGHMQESQDHRRKAESLRAEEKKKSWSGTFDDLPR